MINLNVLSSQSSTAFQKGLADLGVSFTQYNGEFYATDTTEDLTAVHAFISTFDFQAGINADVQKIYEAAIQKHLDAGAQAAGYDNVLSAVSYAGYTNPYQAEGQSFLAWRGNVWSYAYEQMGLVLTGLRTKPTPDELIAELPVRAP